MIIGWFDPNELEPPHYTHRWDQVDILAKRFETEGWDSTKPKLVGYWLDKPRRIQLLSGTHRRAAAIQAGIKVPVCVWDHDAVKLAWGTYLWDEIMQIGSHSPQGLTYR